MPEKLEDDDEISLLEGDTAKLRTSHMSFRSFADELVIYRSRKRTANFDTIHYWAVKLD